MVSVLFREMPLCAIPAAQEEKERRRMRVDNHSQLQTRPLKSLLTRVVDVEMFESPKRLRIIVHARRRGYYPSGRAHLNSMWFTLRLRPSDDPVDIASVAAHELAHCRGLTHRQMGPRYKWSGRAKFFGWATGLYLPPKPESKRERPKGGELIALRLQHAESMLSRARTREKRAATIRKRWAARVFYYQRKAAAMTPQKEKG